VGRWTLRRLQRWCQRTRSSYSNRNCLATAGLGWEEEEEERPGYVEVATVAQMKAVVVPRAPHSESGEEEA
jgi:hypothetical protein